MPPRSFPCPHCETLLTSAGEADFQVACPTCKASVSPPWIPTLALDEAAVPVASAVEEAVPALVPVAGASGAAAPILDDIPEMEEIPAEPPAKPATDWTAFAPPDAPPVQLAPGWRTIPFALNLASIGSAILLITLLFFLVLATVAALQGLQRMPDGSLAISMGTHHRTTIRVEVLILGVGMGLLAGGVFVVLGKSMCCAVPRESHSRAAAVLSALCLFAGLLTQLATVVVNLGLLARWGFIVELRDQFPGAVAGFAAYGLLAGFAFHALEIVLFLMLLRSIGLFFADKRLPPSVIRYFKFTIFGPVVPVLFVGLAYLITRPGVGQAVFAPPELAVIVQVVLGLAPLMMFAYIVALGLWYVVLMRVARDLIIRARLGRLS